MRTIKIQLISGASISLFLIFTLAGCAMYRQHKAGETKRLLTSSGFHMRFADTKEKLDQLKELPQHRLLARTWDGKLRYIYADASICKCAYVGDEKAYNQFQELTFQRRIAEEERLAAERDEPAEMDWGGWRFDKSW